MCGALKLFIARAIDCAMAASQPVVAVPPRAGCIAVKAVAVGRAGMAASHGSRIALRYGPYRRPVRAMLQAETAVIVMRFICGCAMARAAVEGVARAGSRLACRLRH